MNKIAMVTLFASAIVSLPGCTTAQWYEGLQDAQRDRCDRMMEPDRSQCLRNNSTDYETFKKQR